MRCTVMRVLVALSVVTWVGEGMAAKRRPAPQKAQPVVAPPVPQIPAAHPLILFVRDELAQRKKSKPDETADHWLNQLAAYYALPETMPAWVDVEGLLPRAVAVIGELRQAGEFALDPGQFIVQEPVSGRASARELAAAEITMSLAAVKYAWYARGGPIDPAQLSLWLDQSPRAVDAARLVILLREASDPAAELRAFQPKHPQFELLRRAYLEESQPKSPNRTEVMIPPGPRIEPGTRHPDVALVRQRLSVEATGPDGDLFDGPLQDRLSAFMAEAGYGRRRAIDDKVRAALNRPAAGRNTARLTKLRINMERWRWLPRELGAFHVWNNLPEFETKVVKNGEIIHRERIIIGALDTQTPVFSGWMTHIIFHPEWGVPESIKISSLLARLRSGDTSVLSRRNMRIFDGEREISPKSIKWAEVDIRDVPIKQRSGASNPLGQLKFMFPNKHDVYMHDTPGKDLFEANVRTFSHGCVRVRKPQRLAEVLLGEVKGWGPADVRWQMRQATTRLDLERSIPVHNTYFTIVADAAGKLVSLPDIYGHDRRIGEAMAGRSVKQIAASDPALAQKKKNEDLVKAADETARLAQAGELTQKGAAANAGASPGFSLFWFAPSPAPNKTARTKVARKKTVSR